METIEERVVADINIGLRYKVERQQAEIERLRAALLEISRGRGRFSLDRFEHACNVIRDMKGVALAALDGTWEPGDE